MRRRKVLLFLAQANQKKHTQANQKKHRSHFGSSQSEEHMSFIIQIPSRDTSFPYEICRRVTEMSKRKVLL